MSSYYENSFIVVNWIYLSDYIIFLLICGFSNKIILSIFTPQVFQSDNVVYLVFQVLPTCAKATIFFDGGKFNLLIFGRTNPNRQSQIFRLQNVGLFATKPLKFV